MDFQSIKQILAQKGYDFSAGRYHPYGFDVRDYLRRHDVVFRSPMLHGFEGFPVGNGDMAAMVWNSEEGLCLQINKNDLWLHPDEEDNMILRAAGQLKLDFGMPVFNYLYLDDFEGRLNLADAEARFSSATPFCRLDVRLKVDAQSNLMIVDMEGETGEPAVVRLSMERYGSRGYMRWDSRQVAGAGQGLGQARSLAGEDMIGVEESFDGTGRLSCAMAACCVQQGAEAMRVNQRRAELTMTVEGCFRRTLLVAVASSNDAADPLKETERLLAEGKAHLEEIRLRTQAWWGDFWNRSFVHLTRRGQEEAFDYLENLYYMQQYVMGISSRGQYLAPFNGGLCAWNHDIRQWATPHHWNTQQAYWAVEASNHPELAEPYLATYTRMIPGAIAHARKIYGSEHGLAISEAHDFDGRMRLYMNTMTPAQQIAMHFWNHYLFNRDENYLREIAWPFISRCASLYSDFARYDPDTGKCVLGPVMPYESATHKDLYNTTVDGVMMRYILPVALKAAAILGIEDSQTEAWRYLLDHLFDFTYVRDYSSESVQGDMLAMGLLPDMKTVIGPSHGFARSTAPLMPTGIIGKRDRDSRLYKAVRFCADKPSRWWLCHNPKAVIWARLGEGEKALTVLFEAIDSLQHFPQGLFYNLDHWADRSRVVHELGLTYGARDLALPFYQRDYLYEERTEHLNVPILNEEKKPIRTVNTPTQPFAQCGLETPGILTHTLNELHLQSYEGVIRLYPAFRTGYEGMFTLKAAGGFMVSSGFGAGGELSFAAILSLYGGECVLEPPFEEVQICSEDGKAVAWTADEFGDMHFETRAGEWIFLWKSSLREEDIPAAAFERLVNEDCKAYKNATLGRKQQF